MQNVQTPAGVASDASSNISSNELFPVLDVTGFILLPVRNKAKSALPKAMCRSLSTHLTEEVVQ
jgi:hypothetical protein